MADIDEQLWWLGLMYGWLVLDEEAEKKKKLKERIPEDQEQEKSEEKE